MRPDSHRVPAARFDTGRSVLIVALALLVVVAVVDDHTTRRLDATADSVVHTTEVIASLAELETQISQTAERRRGFALTGDARFEAETLASLAAVERVEGSLRRLVIDNPAQLARLDTLHPLLVRRAELTQASLARLRQDGFDRTREAQGILDARAAAEGIERIRHEMIEDELRLREQRRAATRAMLRRARAVELGGTLLSVALIFYGKRRLRREINQRRLSEAQARANAESLSITLQSIGDGVVVVDADQRIVRLNPVASALTGYEEAEALGRPFPEVFRIISEKTRAPAANPIDKVLETGSVVGLANHTALIRKDGGECSIADSAAPIRGADGSIQGVVLVFRDVDDDRAAERKLQEAHAFLDSLVANAPVMLFVKDARSLRFTRLNRAAELILGRSEQDLLGKNDYDFFPPDQAAFFQAKDREVLAGGAPVEIAEEPIATASGERWLRTKKIPIMAADGTPAFLLGISEDITAWRQLAARERDERALLERRVADRTKDLVEANTKLVNEMREREAAEAALLRSEEQLRQSQKMESLGRLAGGIAHDFNNLLTVIQSYVRLWQEEAIVPSADEIKEVAEASRRAAELTHQLLAFGRRQVLEPTSVDMNERLGELQKMLGRLLGEDVRLHLRLAPDLARVRVDPGQIEQVIVNLAINARDAMPAGGDLTIETANVELDDAHAREHLGANPGPHVMLAVSDTGVGMDAATQTRIFEPFFTTKERGKGTGLGLSTALGIVQQSGGTVWVYSEPGKGATFKIYLPRDEAPEATRSRPAPVLRRGSEAILLVEDEPAVRAVVRTVLQRSGYVVCEAADGTQALAILEKDKPVMDLLVTDVIMPGMSGSELAERALALRPKLKILFISGYTDEAVVRLGVFRAGVAFLQKPITPERLSQKVREVLEAQTRES